MPPPEPFPPAATRPGPTDGPPEPPVEPENDGSALDEPLSAPGLPDADVDGPPGVDDPPVEVDGTGEAVANGSEGSGMDALTLGSGIDALTEGIGSEPLIVGSGKLGNGTGSEGRATPLDWFVERSSTASPHACCIPAANTAATRNVIEAISRR